VRHSEQIVIFFGGIVLPVSTPLPHSNGGRKRTIFRCFACKTNRGISAVSEREIGL